MPMWLCHVKIELDRGQSSVSFGTSTFVLLGRCGSFSFSFGFADVGGGSWSDWLWSSAFVLLGPG